MGFFSGVRRRIKKLIPKEVRPFIPYLAAAIPGAGMGLGALSGTGAMGSFLRAGLAKGLSDDEADLKDILRTGAIAATPQMIDAGIGKLAAGDGRLAEMLNATKTLKNGDVTNSFAQSVSNMANPETLMGQAKLIGGQGSIDYGIKAAELNEDALAKYNADLARQGINDKAGRRAAIRAIYSNTGTWDMDEVDGMLDTYGYRTGGRVGYAIGDVVDTEQITEDLGTAGGAIEDFIGRGIQQNKDALDFIIDKLFNLPGPLKTGKEIIEILVERYGVDPQIAQRKIINRMSDANEGFGPQGLDGTPDDGYRRNIGIDAGAEDYYGETPAMPENLGDMGGNMDDMSGNSILNRLRRGQEIMPRRPDLNQPSMPEPDMPRRPDGREFIPTYPRGEFRPGDPGFEMPRNYELLNSGGMAGKRGLVDGPGGYSGDEDEKFEESDFYNSFKYAKEGLESLEEAEDEIKPLPIRELRLADGGRVSELKAAYQRYLDMARKDSSKKIIPFEIFAEEFARENFARGGDVMDINMEEQIDTPSGDMMMDENVEVASNPEVMDSLNELSLMLFRRPLDQLSDDEYEELKDFAGQTSLKPGLIDEYRNYKMGQEDAGQPVLSPRDYFEMDRGAARMGVARGGIMDVNTNMELDIPGMGREDVDVNSMESIRGQTAGPQWYQDRIEALEFEFGDELTDDEIADIAYDSNKFYDKMGYDPGDYKKGGKVIELMPKGILYKGKAKDYPGIKQLIKDMKKKGTRPKKADGGLMSMGGNEMDLRGGGFVPMGAKERADDVPARLSKNEFVMTADAVRGAGGGSVQKGADLMYDQMKRLEGQA